MKTFFVLAADFAYRTAVIEGSHISKKTAEKHAQSLPKRWPDGSRPIVVSYAEMKRMQAPNRNGVSWAIYA
jgi:hypothetical protein